MHLSSPRPGIGPCRHLARDAVRVMIALMICSLVNLCAQVAWASPSAQSAAPVTTTGAAKAGGGVTWKICKTNQCFKTQEAKDKWAQDNQCQFLDDVCSQYTPAEDNAGAQAEDQGFWGSLWDDISGAVVYGYEFVKGLFAGLKGQVEDLVHLVTEFDDVVMGLVQLGKAFYDDPQGTLQELASMLGQDAVDTITKATQCGAYDLGQVIGTYVSPAFALKLASKMTKYSGKLADASKALKHDYGCASFGAGTMVMTPGGVVPIERIVDGQEVLSRNDNNFSDRPQQVTATFGRLAPSYRNLRTEVGTLRVTDEHPFWVQGKGWTTAAEIASNDVLSGANGDVLVTGNEAVGKPLKVYNFSVALSKSYFVGAEGIWAHNSGNSCTLISRNFADLDAKGKGFRGEYEVLEFMVKNDYQPVGKSFDPRGKPIDQAYAEWDGQTGIDGVYKDKQGNYIIIESKATGGKKNADPEDCVGKLCKTKDGRQMSDDWIRERLPKLFDDPNDPELISITQKLDAGEVTKVYAQTDPNGTSYHTIKNVDEREVLIGTEWNPTP